VSARLSRAVSHCPRNRPVFLDLEAGVYRCLPFLTWRPTSPVNRSSSVTLGNVGTRVNVDGKVEGRPGLPSAHFAGWVSARRLVLWRSPLPPLCMDGSPARKPCPGRSAGRCRMPLGHERLFLDLVSNRRPERTRARSVRGGRPSASFRQDSVHNSADGLIRRCFALEA